MSLLQNEAFFFRDQGVRRNFTTGSSSGETIKARAPFVHYY